MSGDLGFDVVVIGSGPAGQKAAIQAAKAGKRVAVIERERQVGGNCVHTGTIPSKSLREHALRQRVRRVDLSTEPIQSLLDGVGETIAAHDAYMAAQVARGGPVRPTSTARSLAATILRPPLAHAVTRGPVSERLGATAGPLGAVLERVPPSAASWLLVPSIGLLPDRIREGYGFPWGPRERLLEG